MAAKTDNLRIDNPCPFVPTRMNKEGDNFYCKSCKKTIIDFREKSSDDIKRTINKDTCGVFTVDQLPGQQRLKPSRQILFYFFSVLSLLGFAVRPLAAQTIPKQKETVTVDSKQKSNEDEGDGNAKIKNKRTYSRRHIIFRRKKRHRIGCPEF
jgi:hypothetical protein